MTKIQVIVLSALLIIAGTTGIASRLQTVSAAALFSNPLHSVDHDVKLSKLNFEDSIQALYDAIGLKAYDMNYAVFRYGMMGYCALKQDGKLGAQNIVSFIDFTKKSTEKRFYTIDLDLLQVKFHSLVSHGKNTGENEAKKFSNIEHSNQSSLGFYVTGETYTGSKGYSLRLDGVDGKFNNNMRARAVVMHDADYVSEEFVQRYGRLGRSQGCPALPKAIAKHVINSIKEKTLIFAYYNDQNYLNASAHLNLDNLYHKLENAEILTAKM